MKTITLKVSGMHCVSCAMNIDGALEDLAGVKSAATNYAKAETLVEYDEKAINNDVLIEAIKSAGYTAETILI